MAAEEPRPSRRERQLEAELTAQTEKFKTAAAELVRTQTLRNSERRQLETSRNVNKLLSAAMSTRAGAVSKMVTSSMKKKETKVLATMLERWHPDDRAELCYRALYASKDEDGERLVEGLKDLKGGMYESLRRDIIHERDLEIAEHLRTGPW